MSVVGTLLGLVLPLFLIVMVVRAVLDRTGVLRVGDVGWAARLRRLSHMLTESALSPVRRELKPVRVGSVRLDLTFTVVFIAALVLRSVPISLSAFGQSLCQASPRHVLIWVGSTPQPEIRNLSFPVTVLFRSARTSPILRTSRKRPPGQAI